MAGACRERKKRQTRQRISDIATGLFLERGFDAVTVAEIAEVAEVSVNTVYNYFPAKEDLFFDREAEQIERSSRQVRDRGPGESAARAVLRRCGPTCSRCSTSGARTTGWSGSCAACTRRPR